MNASAVETPEQISQFHADAADLRAFVPQFKEVPGLLTTLRERHDTLDDEFQDFRRKHAALALLPRRSPGTVSTECARELAARFIIHCQKSNTIEALCSVASERQRLVEFANETVNLQTRSALTTSEIPLPVQYGREIRELISEFGVARRHMSPYPIGMGTSRPARMGTRPAFSSIAMSAPVPEKSPSFSFASLESHKIGGLVRVPRELDEQSIVPIGQFLARYGAVEFARIEDQWAFLADGTATFESVKGIVQVSSEGGCELVLANTKTHPSDATLDDFRNLRTKVDKAALNGRISAYYLDSTWETRLPSFKTAADPNVYFRRADGTAVLDGYPIVWTDVLQPYTTAVAADQPLAVFGALGFWWFGEHGTPRIDTSSHVFFANDQLAVRFIEEIDFDYAAPNATAVLKTAEA
jgi:HK97 family phage major capsid protein